MFGIRKNTPPTYIQEDGIQENFERFFEWGLALKRPHSRIPEIGEQLGFGVRRHPIGFTVVYLSQQNRGLHTMDNFGSVRADIFPANATLEDDIHSHGFDFHSGVILGELKNTMHYPDWAQKAADGNGYIGYQTRVDLEGKNHTERVTDATIVVPRSEAIEIGRGGTYSMTPKIDFHSVASGRPTVTIFCKTPTYRGQDGLSLVLKKPDAATPPPVY